MGKNSSGPAPTPSPQIATDAASANTDGQALLGTAQTQYGIAAGRQANVDSLTSGVTAGDVSAQNQALAAGAAAQQRSTGIYNTLEDSFNKQAFNYGSAGNQQTVANAAAADAVNQGAAQQAGNKASEAAMGINPDSGRYAGITAATSNATALNATGAANTAANSVRQQGMALENEAIGQGANLNGVAAQDLAVGASTGAAASGAELGANAQSGMGFNELATGTNSAISGAEGAGNLLNSEYNSQQQAYEAQQQMNANSTSSLFGGLGSLAGIGLSGWIQSSKDVKTDKKPSNTNLKAVKGMPVQKWTYKKGEGDGGTHVGPYAEDFHKATGLGNDKGINVIDAIGTTMGAVQELSKKVDAMSRSRGITRKAA